MNAALLLMSAMAVGAEPVMSVSICDNCPISSATSGGFSLDRLKCKLKKQECGKHIHCPYPGVIPGTEHPTLCQRIKDALCPNRCMPLKHACVVSPACAVSPVYVGEEIHSAPMPAPAPPIMHKVEKPVMKGRETISMPRSLSPLKAAPMNRPPYGVQQLPVSE